MNPMTNANNSGTFVKSQAVMAHNLMPQHLINTSSPINNENKHLAENYLMSSTSTSFQYSSSNGSNGINANTMMMMNQQQTAPVISQMNPNQLKPNSIYINPSFSKKNSFDTTHQHEQRPLEKESSNKLPVVEKRDEEVAKKKPKKDRKELELLLEKRLAAELAEEKMHENENVSSTKTSSILHSVSTKRKSDQSRNDQGSAHHTHETGSNNGREKSKKYQREERRCDEHDEAKRKRLSQTPTSKAPVSTAQSKTIESKPAKESAHKPAEIPRKEAESKLEKEAKFESLFVDDDYARKLEEQKRKREQILREKEEKRNQRINELKVGKKDALNTASPAVQRKLELKEQVKEIETKKIIKTIGNRFIKP